MHSLDIRSEHWDYILAKKEKKYDYIHEQRERKTGVSRENLVELLSKKSRELSTVTVLFHHWISERLGLNTIDHKCLHIIVRSGKPMTGVQTSSPYGA